MTHSVSVWLVLVAALIAANLPFVNDRWLGVIPRRAPKTLWMRMGELVVCYLLVGALGLGLASVWGGSVESGFWFVAASMLLSGLALYICGEETHPRLNPAP